MYRAKYSSLVDSTRTYSTVLVRTVRHSDLLLSNYCATFTKVSAPQQVPSISTFRIFVSLLSWLAEEFCERLIVTQMNSTLAPPPTTRTKIATRGTLHCCTLKIIRLTAVNSLLCQVFCYNHRDHTDNFLSYCFLEPTFTMADNDDDLVDYDEEEVRQ